MFTSTEFITAWEIWKQHKKEKTAYPYTPTAEQKALSALFKICHGIEQLAIESIDYSIEKNWSAIYIKPNFNGNGQNNGGGQSTNGTKRTQGSSTVEAYRNWGRK